MAPKILECANFSPNDLKSVIHQNLICAYYNSYLFIVVLPLEVSFTKKGSWLLGFTAGSPEYCLAHRKEEAFLFRSLNVIALFSNDKQMLHY